MPKVNVPEEIRKGLPHDISTLVDSAVQKFEQTPNLPGFRLKYVPNSNNQIICIRADKKARLLLGITRAASAPEVSSSSSGFLTTLGDDAVCVLLEVIADHDYDKAQFGEHRHVAKLLTQLTEHKRLYEASQAAMQKTHEPMVPEYQKLQLGSRSYVLDEQQASALHSMHFPALLTGSAGTGKSLLAIAQILQHLDRSDDGARALYLVPSELLKNKIKQDIAKAFSALTASRVDVLLLEEFFVKTAMVRTIDDFSNPEAFYTWLDAQKRRGLAPFSKERLYLECSNRASFISEEDYINSGEKQSSLSLDERKSLCMLFDAYIAELRARKKMDIRLNPPSPETVVLPYSIVVVDEAQCLGAASVWSLCKLFSPQTKWLENTSSNLLFIADVNQVSITGARTSAQVLKSYFAERLASYYLETTYRCPLAVVELAQQCLNLAHQIRGELEKGASRATLKAPATTAGQPVVRIANPHNQLELIEIDKIAQSHNTCLITDKPITTAGRILQQITLVFKPGVVVGLEMADVIIYEPFERNDMLGLLQLCQAPDEAKKNPSAYSPLLSKLLHLYTSITRKTQDEGHVFVLSKYIGEPRYKPVWRFLFPNLTESPTKKTKRSPKTSPDKKSPTSPDKKLSSVEQWLEIARGLAQGNHKEHIDKIFLDHVKTVMSYTDYCREIAFQPVETVAKKLAYEDVSSTKPQLKAKPVVSSQKFMPSLSDLEPKASQSQGYVLLESREKFEELLKYVRKNEKKVFLYLKEKFLSDPAFTFRWFLSKHALLVMDKLSPKSITTIFSKIFKAANLHDSCYPDQHGYNIFQLLLLTSEGRNFIIGRLSFFISDVPQVIASLLREFDCKSILGGGRFTENARMSFLEYLLGEDLVIGLAGHTLEDPDKVKSLLVPRRSQTPKTPIDYAFKHAQNDRTFLLQFFEKICEKIEPFKKEKPEWYACLLKHIFGKGDCKQADRGVLWRLYTSEFGVHLFLEIFVRNFSKDYKKYMDFQSLFAPQKSHISPLDGIPLIAIMLMRCSEGVREPNHAEVLVELFRETSYEFATTSAIRIYPDVPYLKHGLAGLMLGTLRDYKFLLEIFKALGPNITKAFLVLCPENFLVAENTIAEDVGRKNPSETIPLRRMALDKKDGHALLLHLHKVCPDFLIRTKPVDWFDPPFNASASQTRKPENYTQHVSVFSLLLHSNHGLQILYDYCRSIKDFSLLHAGLISETIFLVKGAEPMPPLRWLRDPQGSLLLKLLLKNKPQFITSLDLNDCEYEDISRLCGVLFSKEWFEYLVNMLDSQSNDTIHTLHRLGAQKLKQCSFYELFKTSLGADSAWFTKLIIDGDSNILSFSDALERLAPLALKDLETHIVNIRENIHPERRLVITGDDEDGPVLPVMSMFSQPRRVEEQGGEVVDLGTTPT